MIILCGRLISNPLPDFQDEPIIEKIAIELSDEDIKRIGDKYFELVKGPLIMGGTIKTGGEE